MEYFIERTRPCWNLFLSRASGHKRHVPSLALWVGSHRIYLFQETDRHALFEREKLCTEAGSLGLHVQVEVHERTW